MVGYNVGMKERDDKEEIENPRRSSPRKKSGKKSGLGLALWVLAALGLLIFFLVEQDKIIKNLKETDFFHRVFGKTPAFVENHPDTPIADSDKNDVAPIDLNVLNNSSTTTEQPKNDSANTEPADSGAKSGVVAENDEAKTQEKNAQVEKSTTDAKNNTKKNSTTSNASPEKKPVTVPVTQMNIKLFFMNIDSDGSVNRKEVTRKMKKSASPLADAINALISGPIADEEKVGCRSLIPAQSKLLGATVSDGVATLNFSEEFEFNQYGVEGTLGQLQQIVYTATAFPTVNSVQILVEGDKKEYLGSEGVWIGTPLSRNSFK